MIWRTWVRTSTRKFSAQCSGGSSQPRGGEQRGAPREARTHRTQPTHQGRLTLPWGGGPASCVTLDSLSDSLSCCLSWHTERSSRPFTESLSRANEVREARVCPASLWER